VNRHRSGRKREVRVNERLNKSNDLLIFTGLGFFGFAVPLYADDGSTPPHSLDSNHSSLQKKPHVRYFNIKTSEAISRSEEFPI